MTIIVTGGAGFIGSNFIFHMMEAHPDYRIVCLDCLTYAGNLSTLAPVMDKPNFRFVKESITDRDAVYKLFEEEHPDYRVLPLDASVLPRCREFTEKWYDVHIENGSESDFSGERIAIAKAFDNFDALGMEGIALETDGKLVAFSMGNRIREDTYDVNFEKAMAQVNGAYPMINREFARLIRQRYPEIRYLNREDDMGIAGLRRAKESYTPDILLEKYLAEEAEA